MIGHRAAQSMKPDPALSINQPLSALAEFEDPPGAFYDPHYGLDESDARCNDAEWEQPSLETCA